jgi:hypothetical protein
LSPKIYLRRPTLALLLALAPALASAQTYKWIDENGHTQYSDQPPPAGVKAEKIGGSKAPPPPPAAKAPQSAAARDLEFKKRQLAAEEKQKDDEKDKKDKQNKAELCDIAKARLKTLQDGGRILKYDKAGERDYMSDEDIEKEKVPAQAKVDELCKG